uniref:Dystonin n=1 Tax=Oncorhynchus tshawytscha TaxID=74940 RepID=A0A8C8D9H4_ONCTS
MAHSAGTCASGSKTTTRLCMSSGSGNASLHCSMSSSADFSDEDDYSFKSGSVSPAPGDTLPWNLPRHERHKRKIQGGSVLDPAERAVLRIADERDRVQKKTFTKWINQHLLKVRKHVNDLYEDLRDGHNLISLLEVLSGQSLPREKGRMRFHRLQNVQIALDYLKRRQVKLVNIRNDDITDGNPKLTLGLIWTIILHFQISEIHVCGESEDMTAKERLLMWSQQMTEGYVGVRCNNFTTSWRDGRLFNAIIHKYRPDLVDMGRVSAQTSRSNLEQAFGVAERLGVARLLDPEDVDVQSPDEKSVITYVSTMYDVFPKVPDGVDGINANDVDIKWVEYQNMVNYLIQWIKHNVGLMSDRAFPNNPVELKALYTQYLQFKENEIPLKETEKSKIKHLYKMLEVWMEFGRIQLPRGFHPNDVEKEWGKLIVAMLEREKSLRPEVDRQVVCLFFFTSLLLLNFVIEKYITNCLDIFFFSQDAKRLESGVQFQNESEVSGYLLECENHLRQQVVDIQILLDGKFYCSDRLVQRCKLTAFSKCHATHVNKHNICWGMDPGSLQHHKYMQIRKPLGKSSLLDPNMTKEEVNMNFVQDLINWVEEMQVQLDHGDWGADLPSVETHLENHRSVHRAIEEFQMSLKEAKLSEMQMTQAQKLSYSEKLGNLEYQYGKLLKCSRERQKNLESLHDFVSRATMELIWLNEKEEEEVAFDWSDRNGNISKKRQYHADLMRELDDKEKVIKSVQDNAENLLQENHPARLTIEAYRAAMQTQWSWILQLCSCVEQHLKDNTVYFEFFNDAKESMDYLKSLQGDIQRKYGCDRTSSVHKLEDHIQESMDEKEQLLQYRSTVAGLVGKAKAIVQLKPRTPDTPIRSSIPVKAICDYRQIEITIYKDDECVLASNSHRAKWKVISPSGNEAMVPSVCFTVPPPNKEAVDQASRIEQLYQNVLTLWHHSHINMKSVVSWHYLMADVKAIRNWNTMLPGEHQQVLSNLQSHFEDFLEDSEESEVFTMADCSQLEREVLTCKDQLILSKLLSVEQEEHEESKKAELDQLMEGLETMKEKCETFLRQATASPSVPALSSDLNVLIQSMSQVYSMSSIYLEKLKTVSLVVRHSQNAEALVKFFEAKLSEEDAVNSDLKSIDTVVSTLKVSSLGSKIDEQREVFHDLEDGLQKARGISDHMFKAHNERDFDLDWHKEKADQLGERWHDVHTQIDSRLVFSGQLKCLGTDLIPYTKMEAAQLKTLENQPEDSKALAELLNQQKVLVAEMEHKQSRIDECQKYSEQYSSGAKDYELQLMTYRAMVDSQHKSPLKRRRMQNSADAIVQEFMDLRTRYTAVVTSMTQYVKFASETLKRTEGEEVGDCVYELADLILSRMVVVPDANSPLAGLWDVTQKRRVTILQGHQQSLIDRLTALRLLEAQACTGGICDPASGEKATVTEALRRGLLDETFARQLQQCEQTIEGVLEVGSVEVYSVFSSVQSGLIDHYTGLCLLEAQLITSGLVLPQLRMCLELDDAFHHNLIDEPTWKQLRELNEANQCILSPLFSSEPLPVIAAVREGAISERLAMKFIEIQLATGGLRVSYTSDVLTLERAFQFGLIPDHLYVKLLERQDTWKDLINPSTAEKVSLTQLVQRSVADVETGLRLLPVKKSHNGNMELTSGREISVLSAVHEGLIDRQTTMRLLGAQLFAGGIVNPKTGHKLTVEEALSEGLIDQGTATGILSQQAQNGGIVNPQNGKTLSVDEAVQCNLMSSSSALLVLEKQKGFMGLLWPHSGEILTVSTSLQHEIITNQLAFKLLSNRQKIAALYIAEDSEVVDINSATQNGLIDTHTAEVLKTIEIPDVFPDVDDLNDRFSSWLMLRELQIGGSHRPTDDIENDGENINAPSPIEAKQLFISYLMLNSYMDPKSGQRLLIFDGQLTKMAELLVNISVETSENQLQNTVLGKAAFVDISLKEDISEVSEISFESNTEDFGYLHINEETDGAMKDHHASNERGFAIHLLRAQLEEGGILDIISGKRYDLDAALDKGLVDEETVLEVLALQLHKGEVLGDERSTVATLKEAVSRGSISSQIALQIMEQQSLLGGVYDSKSGCTIRVNEALDSGMIDDDLAEKILHSDPVHNAIIDPDRNCMHSISYSQSLGLIDNNEAENICQHQTDKKVAVLVLDAPDEDVNGEEGKENRNRHAGEDVDAEGNREQNCDSQKSLLPSFTISHGPVCRQILSPILSDQVTGEHVIHQPDTSSLLREDGSSQAPNSPLSDMVPGSRNSIHNDMLSNKSNCLSLIDSGDSGAPQAQAKEVRQTEKDGNSSLRRGTDLSCEAIGFTPGDGQLGAGYREIMGNQTVSPVQSDSGVSCSSHSDLLSDERKMENVLNAIQPPASQLVKESDQRIDSSSLRDLSSDVTSTVSAVVGVNVDKMVIHSDGLSSFSTVSPQQLLVKSDGDIGGDIKPTSSQNGYSQSKPTDQKKTPVQLTNSSDLAIVSSVLIIETHCDNNDSYDVGDQEQLETAPTKVISSRITPDLTLTDKHLSNSNANVNAKANDRVESSRGDDITPSSGRQEDSSDGSVSQITDQADSPTVSKSSQTGQTGTGKCNSVVSEKFPDTSSSSASEMFPGYPLKATEPGMRSVVKQDECGAVENHPQPMAAIVQPDSSSNTPSTSEMTSQHLVKGKEHLEDTAFDTQYFISEHAQFLSPAQSRHLLKSLSATQRAIKDQMERVANQRCTLQLQLEISENESQQKVWTQMTGLRAIAPWKESISALQKDILTNGSALNEVISSTKKFLDENRSMLTPDQIAAIESKLEDAKSKVKLINQRAEESRKDVEKSVTTAIKQETEKAHHQEILSQQQDMIMATQSAQALLDHQAHALSSTEKDKLQMDIQELKGRYDASLTQAEQQMKQVVQVQEELKKFQGDCEEFEGWLQQAEGEVGELGAPAGALNILTEKLQRQKSFSEDVISHKGDLRFITISGQKVLDVAKACGRMDPKGKDAQLEVDTTGTCATVKDKLDSVAGRYKALHSQVNFIYQYHKTDLAHDIVERYDNLSKSVSDRNEKLQITLTRSLSVQDGLDEMMSWMEGVEESVKEKGQVPLDSAAIGDVLSNGALEQDISSRQSSISAMKAKVKKFVETADPSAAALLQSKMDALSQRFSDTCDKHKQKMEQLEQLKDKVEEFEKTSDKVQQFVLKRSQALSETDGPGKNVNELSQLMQLAEHAKDVEILQKLSKELSNMGPEGSMAQIQGKIDNLSNNFNAFKDTVKEKYVKMTVAEPPADPHVQSTCGDTCSHLTQKKHHYFISPVDSHVLAYLICLCDLMVVQQNMSYINEGHERLGELLKDRAAELSGLVQQMAEAQKETDAMITWLKDMKKTTASWNSASTEKDAMKTQLEQQKVDSAKFKLPGCFVLTDVCSSDAAWADVSGSVENRKQHLEESNRILDVFQTTEPQLRQWLSEKEMMLSVLGPLSMDPNMLNTQRQQVQILLNEFDSRKPQYDQLNEAAAAILSTSAKQDPSSGGKVVKDQLAAVTQKWQGLTGQLRQRAGLIDQAVGKTGQFQDLLRSLSQSAASLETRLNSQQALSSQPDVVKKQLEEANIISGQLREERKRLKEAETLCSELSALVTEDYLKTDLARQLEVVTKPFKQLEDKAVKRIQQLNSAFASSQQFHQTSKDFQGWMNEMLQEQSKSQAVSALVENLQQSLKEHSALQKALSEHKEPYSTIVREGETLLQNTDGAEKVALQGQLATLRSNWDDVKKSSSERQDKLQGALQRAQKYHEHAEKLQSWVQESEVREGSVRLSVDPAVVESSISQLKAIQKDVDKHRGLVAQLNTAAESLLEVANADIEAVREEKAAIGQSVDRVTERVQNKRDSLDKISQRLKEFNDTHKEAKGQLAGAKKQLDAHTSLGVQAYSNKNLISMKAQQKSLDGVNTQLEHLKSLAQGLVADVPEADGVTDLLLQADSLEKEYGSLSKDVGKTCSTLEGKLQGIGQFQTNIREMFTCFADLDDELDSMAPVGRELATLNEQQGGIKVFMEKLQELMADTARGEDRCKKMLETEASPDLLGLKRDLDVLSKQCGKLMDRAKGREEEVGSTFTRLNELYSKLQQFTNKLGGAEVKEEGQGSVGMETDVINQQLEAFKVFQKEEVDPLQTQLQDINWLGQGLIQNAAKGTSTKGLEHDLEDGNTRWNTLNKKIAERSAQLHEALLHCGRFQDALESLLSWLTDTEELVSNQKPPSAEFKVVKAQIQEQILLQRLLDDRRPTVELIKKEGGKVVDLGAEFVEKEKVGKEIECLGQRWDALLKKAENRHKQLKSILVVAQQFHETLEPLSEWLSATEKRLAKSEPIGTQTTKLEVQISQHKALHEDIELRKQNVDQAISNGLELLKQTTGDEVVVIQGKLDGIKTRYAEINSMSGNVSKTLDQALTLASKLQHIHEDLSSWLENVETELTAFAAQEPVGEQLIQAQDRQKALLKEAMDHKPQVDKLNEVSSSLLELVPWRAREGLDKLVTEDNDRYKAASDTITQHVEQINAAILKSQQFEQAADNLLAWLTEAERKMLSLGEIRLEQDQTTAQLQAQKGFSMDIMRHKDAVDDIHTSTSSSFMFCFLQVKIQALLEKYGVVSQLNSERCLQLERAQSLASQFWETYEELWPWLQETRTSFSQLPLLAIEYEALRQQQEELRQMRELIAEHKPHIDKMNKTGPQLLELSPVEGIPIREKYTATDLLYAQLKADVKQRAATLDEAISKSTQFHDKIEPMLESLERIAERLRQPPSISVEVEKIREQITENKAVSVDLEKLQPSYDTLKQRGEEMIARSAGADKDISAKAVQDKLDQMVFTWNEIHALMEEREAKLLDVMDLADKFWCDHCALIVTIKDTQDLLRELEEPGVDPSVVKQQQESLESFKEEIDGLQEELDVVRNLGAELMAACGEPDKPVIKKSIDEVNSAWETLNKSWKERVDRLDEAMQAAVQFQDGLQGMFDWVDIVEHKLDSMSPVGTDLDTVKQQIEELKEFKGEAYQLQIEMERLNHQAGLLLKKVTEEYDRCAIQEPMTELKMLWDNLDENIINRQHKLEGALLALGQFQHALDELLAWMSNTEELLNEQRKAAGDPKAIEIELAKHHVLQNDVLAHKTTVEVVNKAGTDLVESTSGEEASGLQSKLENLTQRWKNILEKTEQRRHQLDGALLQAQGFHGEMEDMQQWLKDTERQLLASKAVGGLPDTAREQLNAHLELCSTLEAKEELYQQLMNKGQQLLTMTPSNQDSNTEQDLRNLQDKRESVQVKVAERKVKLEEALTLATEFHNSLQDFINWLTQAEQTLTMSSPASLILENIMFQIDEHKVFVTEVNSHREQIVELDKTGTHLKYFSQKQDVVLIKNLLISVQGRWEKVVQRSVERGRLLDDARKRAKQFHETWNKLTEWLDESEKALDSELEIANDPDKIKMQLAQHKEFQKALGSKHSVYDTTSRTGRALKDKTSLQDDNQKLDDMLSELRDKWDTVCGKSVERQNKLEEALLFSGQFTDALQALIDWLYRVEPQLAEDQPVHGDIDLVLNLIDSHKVFQKELGKRTGSVAALKRSAKDLIESSHEDSSWVKAQMQELSARWETVCARSVSKQTRLEQALCQAEEFHSTVHILLEWLAEAEQSLRFHGTLPDDEDALRALIEQHKEFMKKQEEKGVGLNKATSMGEAILTICHPDSITTIKHWNTIIKARFEEVQAWARQHQQRLAMALSDLLATQELLEGLLGWLQWAEATLNEKDKEVLPQEIDEVKALIAEHQTFMEEMTRKQPDVDTITKTHKRKAVGGSEPAIQSQIPVLEKGRGGRKRSPTQAMYPSASQPPIVTKNPRVNLLVSKWQQVWLLALDRRRKLNDAMDRLEELKEFANFDFDVWRKRYMRWMNHKKSRVMDFFRRIDKDQDGKVTRQEFIEGILSSKFPTSRLEMSAVADIFDRDGDGYIDYYEFVAALHPNKEAYKPLTDADKIEDEVTRQVAKCKCPKRFQVEQIGANKYRFGDSQQLRLVRILRSTVMVRVGGGWMALDEFLVKNDPCRAKGRTNMELREKFILPEGTTQVMASFRYRGRRSRPSSRAASPNRSNSSHSCPAQHNNPALPSTPKSTPIQGSKLRALLFGSAIKVTSRCNQTITIPESFVPPESRRSGSRPGSKAGSRGSSRRGSDASDFDISDIASVCSDTSETVGDTSRATPRSSSRQHGGKPSRIPTPQRRSTPSKLAQTSKR